MKLGYACINLTIPTRFRTCRLKTLEEQGMQKAKELTLNNFLEVEKAVKWNIENGIYFYRLSSDLVPFASHPIMDWKWYEDEDILEVTDRIRELAAEYNMRLSMHPGQYTILNSTKQEVIDKAILDLEYHARVLEMTGGQDMILHTGGAYGDKEKAKERFIETYRTLPQPITSILILENDDKVFHLEDVVEVSRKCGIPVCFDIHHHRCNTYPGTTVLTELLDEVVDSWKTKGRPKMHISSGRTGPEDRSHHDYVLEEDFDSFLQVLGSTEVDIMLEAKLKEKAVLRIYEHLGQTSCLEKEPSTLR
jgi:UV DNA damage endonuclease